MRVECIGGGPAGLYLGILLKKEDPSIDVVIHERNALGDTFGWGVVFSDETLSYLEEADRETGERIRARFAHWDAIDVYYKNQVVRSGGHGFSGISRKVLLEILTTRAIGLGVDVRFKDDIEDPARLAKGADLLVAADGVNSRTRALYADHFRPVLDPRRAKYIWLGTKKTFDAFTFYFEEHEAGLFQVHAYRFEEGASTFIVETDPDVFDRAGLGKMSDAEQIQFLEKLFARHLKGEKLLSNRSSWLHFGTLKCGAWSHENIVLIGDAAHTAHFSIGSGTKLAMEDSIALAKALLANRDVPRALAAYEAERRPIVERTQSAAQDSLLFFEHTKRYLPFDPLKFTFRLLTRSKRIGYDNLAVRDAGFARDVTESFAKDAGAPRMKSGAAPPPMFTPYALGKMHLENRVVLSPMCMYSATGGTPNDFHLVHLGSRAIGGAGLIFTEMTDVSAEGRISPGCTGIYAPEHVTAWRRITDFVHARSHAKIGIQLGHAGRKASTKVMWEGMDLPLDEGNWPVLAPSAIAHSPRNQVPREMDRADMDRVKAEHVRAAKMADDAGFDLIELHMAHGYLLATFLSPLTNVRKDAYGGSVDNRARWPLEVLDAVRAAWPKEKPIAVRISATDWYEGGTTNDDALTIARALHDHGADIIDVSTGGTVPDGKPAFYGRMYQTPFSDQIRNEAHIPTMTVGNITSSDQVNTILAAGRADLVVLARAHLRDPYFTMHAAEHYGFTDLAWPPQYSPVVPRGRPA